VFQAVLTAATQDGAMAAVKLLIDRESLIECAEPGAIERTERKRSHFISALQGYRARTTRTRTGSGRAPL